MKGLFGALLIGPICALGQGPTNSVVGAGYSAPAPVSAAPGQVITLFLAATGVAVPSFAGVTATLQQGGAVNAPVLAVSSVSTCPGGGSVTGLAVTCSSLTAVTVQVPYELRSFCPLCESPVLFSPWLYVSYHGAPGNAIQLNPLADQVHVLTACDVLLQTGTNPGPVNYNGLPCSPIVTHGDGSAVSASNPAKPGEEIIAWATGLGATNPATPTGQPAAAPVPTAEALGINFDYELNALPVKPRANAPAPLYSGLVAGFLGLYQINFVVPPEPPSGIPQCVLTGTFAAGGNVPQSNLTVSFGGQFSFDGAGICVQTHVPVD